MCLKPRSNTWSLSCQHRRKRQPHGNRLEIGNRDCRESSPTGDHELNLIRNHYPGIYEGSDSTRYGCEHDTNQA